MSKRFARNWRRVAALAVLAVLFWCYGTQQNGALGVTRYDLKVQGLPSAFEGQSIALLTDLHNTTFWPDKQPLLDMVAQQKPAAILIAGDLVDSYRTDVDLAIETARRLAEIAPVYFAPGNHEPRLDYDNIRTRLVAVGVTVLDDEIAYLECGGQTLPIVGVRDLSFYLRENNDDKEVALEKMTQTLAGLMAQAGPSALVMCHRPLLFPECRAAGAKQVLSGHAHGGQMQLPGGRGLFVPSEGFFARYTQGLHEEEGARLIISRGLGNSLFPWRINNPPEIVMVDLTCA